MAEEVKTKNEAKGFNWGALITTTVMLLLAYYFPTDVTDNIKTEPEKAPIVQKEAAPIKQKADKEIQSTKIRENNGTIIVEFK